MRRWALGRLSAATAFAIAGTIAGIGQAAAAEHPVKVSGVRVGHAMPASMIARLQHPQGKRMRSGRRTNAVYSQNWSGLIDRGTGIEGAEAYWTVPGVQASSSPLYSSTWVGVDGVSPDNNLIQTGTSQDTSDGYTAWWEILPAASVVITDQYGNPAPVAPGDQMLGGVQEASLGTWTITLEDLTQGWEFQQNFNYYGPGQSAEWIEEAPQVGGSQSQLANFGSVGFTQTGEYGDFGPSGTTWYGTSMSTSNEVDMTNASGTEILAAPSAPTFDPSGGQDFTDTYGPPVHLTPPRARISSPNDNYQLSRTIRVTYSATDPSSPVTSYDVRYFAFPWNSSTPSGYRYPSNWQRTTSRSVSLVGVPGDEYCFEVRATSRVGATSSWTSYSCAILPLGEASLRASAGSPVWIRHNAPQCYLCSFAEATRYGATLQLSGAWANQVAIVATRCPSCGVVGVWINNRFIGSINTHGAQTQRNAVFVLPSFANGRVTVSLVDESRRGAVILQGLGIG
jgi:hypothetical protein